MACRICYLGTRCLDPEPARAAGKQATRIQVHSGSGLLPENGIQQSRKPRVEFGAPQGILMDRAGDASLHKACLAQDPEVVGHARFGAAAVELPAGGFGHMCQLQHDLQAQRIAQRVEHALESKVLGRRMIKYGHPADGSRFCDTPSFDIFRTIERESTELSRCLLYLNPSS